MIEIKTYSKPKKTGGSGGSSSSTKYISGVISEAEHAGRADKAKRAEVADQANYAGTAASAQNAAYASEAGNLHADAEILQKYLSKDTVDPQVVNGMVTFAKGLIAKALVDLEMGAKFGNNAKITNLGEAVFSVIKSIDYDNAAEHGFSVEKENNGKYHAFFTNLTIWGKAIFHELEIRKLSYSGGNIYLSGAGSKLIKVVPVKQSVSDGGVTSWVEMTDGDAESECAGWKCYLLADDGTTATMNDWQEGDQARCQTMGEIVAGGAYSDVSNKSYWRTIPNDGVSTQNEKIYGTKTETYIDEDGNEQTREVQVELYDGQAFAWIVIGKHSENFDGYTEDSAPDETKDIPSAGDTIVLDGNRHRDENTGKYDKTDRQNVIILETTGEYAPRIACYANITEYKHTFTKSVNGSNKEVSLSVFETSPKGGTKINSSRFEWISDDGSTINIINYRGDWVEENTTYHKNDQVNHNNAVWVCVANSGVDVTEEPSDGATYWKKVLSGGKGDKGDDAVSYTVTLTRGSNGITQGLYVGVTRYIGTACTTGTIIDFGMSCKAYTDGTLAVGLTDRLQTSDNYIDFAAFPKAKSFTVELLDRNDNKVATGNYSSGDDAISILVEDAPLVFDTDDNGIVSPSVTKTAKVKVMRGNTNVTNDCNQESSRGDLSLNCMCDVTKDEANDCINVSVQGSWIVKNDVIIDGVNQGTVSTTSGYAVAQFVYDSVVYFAQVPFSVNVAKFTGVVAFNNKQYESKFKEISTKFGKDLAEAESRITQTAREISLSVSEKSIGRRNLLVGSAFLREDNNRIISNDARIEMNSGYQGTNCIHVIDATEAGNPHYVGVYWDGSQGGKSIKIEKGKKYTMSCFCKTNDINAEFYLEAIYTDKQENAIRKGQVKYLSPNGHTVKKVNEWELFTTVVDTTDAEYDYIAFNFWEACTVAAGQIEAWICRPMVEEGDKYNGWTLSQDDYDYIGGNMLDNTLSLDKSGSLYDVNGTLTPAGFGESTSIYKSFVYKLKGTVDSFSQLPSSGNVYDDTYFVRNDGTCYAYNGSEFENVGNDYYYEVLSWRKSDEEPFGLEANKDYVFSFMAKGTGRLTAYFYYPDTDVFIEDSLGGSNIVVNGQANFQLTNKWERYWVHWRPSDSLHRYIILRLGRTIQSSEGDAPITNCYIAQPKLEEGAVVTEYTERKSDLVDKASLKKAGIEITSDQVTLYGNKVQVKNPKENPSEGYDEAAMFQNGKLNAQFINADEVVAKGIRAKNLEATNLNVTGNSKFGIWEIRKDDTFGEMIQARGDLQLPSGHTAQGSGVQYLPLYIRGGLANANYFRVGVSCTEFSYSYNSRDFCGVWTGKAADYVCGSVANTAFNTPTEYGYDESYHPAEYIYTTKSLPNDPALAINVVKTKGSSNGERTAIQTNAAIRGVLAPNSMSISLNNDTIPSGIGVVICTNGSEITLTLPANPIEGQTLIIIQGSDKRVYIVPYGDEVIYCSGQTRDKSNKFFSGMIGQFNIFVFIRGNWQLQFVNNRA